MTITPALPAPGAKEKVTLKDVWGWAESQEAANISPAMYKEFVLPYLAKLSERFGLVYYGCCERVDDRIEMIIDAIPNLRLAIEAAAGEQPGVYVAFGGKVLSPLNLKFERVAPDGFRNWNTGRPRHTGNPLFADTALAGDRERLRERLEAAINASTILRVYPGMRGDQLIGMMDRGIRNFVLELYDTGTASLRESPYSLRKAFAAAKTEASPGLVLITHANPGFENRWTRSYADRYARSVLGAKAPEQAAPTPYDGFLDALIAERDPYCRGVLILGQSADVETLAQGFRDARASRTCRGFAVGRTIFNAPARAWLANEIDDAAFKARVRDTFERLIDAWKEARS